MVSLQPTVHFAEDTLVRSEDEETPPFPSGKQRLIRKDTPHYKKHFRIAQLPRPEAVVALLQGFGASGGPQEEEEEKPEQEEAPEQTGWGQEEAASEGGSAVPPSVKVRASLGGGLMGGGWAGMWGGGDPGLISPGCAGKVGLTRSTAGRWQRHLVAFCAPSAAPWRAGVVVSKVDRRWAFCCSLLSLLGVAPGARALLGRGIASLPPDPEQPGCLWSPKLQGFQLLRLAPVGAALRLALSRCAGLAKRGSGGPFLGTGRDSEEEPPPCLLLLSPRLLSLWCGLSVLGGVCLPACLPACLPLPGGGLGLPH